MTDTSRGYRVFVRMYVAILLLIAFVVTNWLSFSIAPFLKSDCIESLTPPIWSSDRAYSAQILKQTCEDGSLTIYSAQINAHSPPRPDAFYTLSRVDQDVQMPPPPLLVWTGPREVEVTVKTKALTGLLHFRIGPDVDLVNHFVPSPDVSD